MTLAEMAFIGIVFLGGVFCGCVIWEAVFCDKWVRSFQFGARVGAAIEREKRNGQEEAETE